MCLSIVAAVVSLGHDTTHAQITLARFNDATQASGVSMETICGHRPPESIVDTHGSGVALFDFDNDGDLDAFIANGAEPDDPEHGPGSKLFVNRGDGTFTDGTQRFGINVTRWANGVAVGDYNGDGWDDLYITCHGANVLLRNDCGKPADAFVDVTSQAGVGDASWGTSAAFADVDGDGDLDLYVVNYLDFDAKKAADGMVRYKGVEVMAGPTAFQPQRDVFYENRGDGTFTDRTFQSGCFTERAAYGVAVRMADFDADGRTDIFVVNDASPNFLFRNYGSGQFVEIAERMELDESSDGVARGAHGVAIADFNGDGRPDVLIPGFACETDTLLVSSGKSRFDDRTQQFGFGLLTRPMLSWGMGVYDFDCDGDEDLFRSNGHVFPQAADHKLDADYGQPPALFERVGATRFVATADAGIVCKTPMAGRAAAFGDIDGDGDVDVVMTTLNGPVHVLQNDSPARSAVVVDLSYKGANRRGLGATIELRSGGRIQRRWIHGGGAFQSSDAPIAYFGLYDQSARDVELHVIWPNGQSSPWQPVPVKKRLRWNYDDNSLRMDALTGH